MFDFEIRRLFRDKVAEQGMLGIDLSAVFEQRNNAEASATIEIKSNLDRIQQDTTLNVGNLLGDEFFLEGRKFHIGEKVSYRTKKGGELEATIVGEKDGGVQLQHGDLKFVVKNEKAKEARSIATESENGRAVVVNDVRHDTVKYFEKGEPVFFITSEGKTIEAECFGATKDGYMVLKRPGLNTPLRVSAHNVHKMPLGARERFIREKGELTSLKGSVGIGKVARAVGAACAIAVASNAILPEIAHATPVHHSMADKGFSHKVIKGKDGRFRVSLPGVQHAVVVEEPVVQSGMMPVPKGIASAPVAIPVSATTTIPAPVPQGLAQVPVVEGSSRVELAPATKMIEDIVITSDKKGRVTMTAIASDGSIYEGLDKLPQGAKLHLPDGDIAVGDVIVYMETLPTGKIISTFADGKKLEGVPVAGTAVHLMQIDGKIPANTVVKAKHTTKGMIIQTQRDLRKGVPEDRLMREYKPYASVSGNDRTGRLIAGIDRDDVGEERARSIGLETVITPELQDLALKFVQAYRLSDEEQKAFLLIGKLGINHSNVGVGYAQEINKALVTITQTLNYYRNLAKDQTIRHPNSHSIEDVVVAAFIARVEKGRRALEAQLGVLVDGKVYDPDGRKSEATLQKGALIGSVQVDLPAQDLGIPLDGIVSPYVTAAYGNSELGTVEGGVKYTEGNWSGRAGVLSEQEAALFNSGVVEKDRILKGRLEGGYSWPVDINNGQDRLNVNFRLGTLYSSEGFEPYGQVAVSAAAKEVRGDGNGTDLLAKVAMDRQIFADKRIKGIQSLSPEKKAEYLRTRDQILADLQAGKYQNIEAAYEAWIATLILEKNASAPDWQMLQVVVDYALSLTVKKLESDEYQGEKELLGSLSLQLKALRGSLIRWLPQFVKEHPGVIEQNILAIDDVLKVIEMGQQGKLSSYEKKTFMAKVLGNAKKASAGPSPEILKALITAALKGRTPTPAAVSCEASDFSWAVNNGDIITLGNAFAAATHACLAQGNYDIVYSSSGEPATTVLLGGTRTFVGGAVAAPDPTDLTATLRKNNIPVKDITKNVFVDD